MIFENVVETMTEINWTEITLQELSSENFEEDLQQQIPINIAKHEEIPSPKQIRKRRLKNALRCLTMLILFVFAVVMFVIAIALLAKFA